MDSATAPTAADAEPQIFAARLTPHRSLSRRGFRILMGGLGALCFGVGILFWSMGAWPITGFFGLDLALLWLAFRINNRDGRAFEEVRLTRSELVIRRVSPRGRETEIRLNPFWTRLVVERIVDEGVVRIAVTSHGRDHEIGGFLAPEDRASFGDAFAAALSRARAGAAA